MPLTSFANTRPTAVRLLRFLRTSMLATLGFAATTAAATSAEDRGGYLPKVYRGFKVANWKTKLGLSWRVENNFRVLSSQEEQERYYHDLGRYYDPSLQGCWGHGLERLKCLAKFATHREYVVPAQFNYVTRWKPSSAQFEPNWAVDRHRKIRANYAAAGASTCSWKLDGVEQREKSCKDALIETTLGTHKLVVRPDKEAIDTSEDIDVRDVLILAVGDSYGAGEGAPVIFALRKGRDQEKRPGEWMDRRCHNSLYAGFAQAAARLAQDDQHQSVTFLSYACSGAEIDGDVNDHRGGILSPYWGRETYFQVSKAYDGSIPATIQPIKGPIFSNG